MAELNLREHERIAIAEASRTLRDRFPVTRVVLFGSKARGDDAPESDIDLLVLTSRPLDWKERRLVSDMLYPICLDLGVIISTLVVDEEEWLHGASQALPIRSEIDEQGVAA